MRELNKFFDLEEDPEMVFQAKILEGNNREADLLIKRGYKIKKPVWYGLIAS